MRPLPCVARLVVLVCTLIASSPAQTHFTRVWSGTPYLAMNVYVTAASWDSTAVGAGDEIGLFDGPHCVGLAVLAGPIVSGSPLSVIASTDDPTTPAVDGFTVGHPIAFRLWRSSRALEYPDSAVTRAFTAGTGAYASLGTAVVSLSARLLTGVMDEPQVRGYRLCQNYPNPFNGISNFEIRISNWGWVKLAVYDLLGREVAVLVNDHLGPGAYAVHFDGSQLASGVYVCRMMAGAYVAEVKLILQR